MIDTHCHLLPGVDDGARDLNEAIELADGLVSAGVHTVACTPHVSRRWPTSHDYAARVLKFLEDELERAGIALTLTLGAEFSPAAAMDAQREDMRRWRLGGPYVLVELDGETPAGMVSLIVSRLAEFELKPVLGHPERCPAVRDRPYVIDAARNDGSLVQVVARDLAGNSTSAKAAWGLIGSGRVDLVASDSHRPNHATERLPAGLELIAARFGDEAVEQLTETNPARALGLRARQR